MRLVSQTVLLSARPWARMSVMLKGMRLVHPWALLLAWPRAHEWVSPLASQMGLQWASKWGWPMEWLSVLP